MTTFARKANRSVPGPPCRARRRSRSGEPRALLERAVDGEGYSGPSGRASSGARPDRSHRGAAGSIRVPRQRPLRPADDGTDLDRLRRRLRSVLAADLRASRDRRGSLNTTVPPQLRAAGAATVYFDLKFPLRVGSPAKPFAPEAVQAQADKTFDAAVASTGCQTPVIAENELFGADLVTPWSATNTQYRADVLAYLTRLAQRGALPYLLISKRPYTDGDAGAWWVQASKVASIVPEVYFNGPQLAKQGPILASRRLRVAFRKAITSLTDLGIPSSRVGIVLGFQVARGAGGREHLQPSSKWFRVVKWQALAAKQVAAETHVGTIWSWGWGTWSVASTDPDKPRRPASTSGCAARALRRAGRRRSGLQRLADRRADPAPRRDAVHRRGTAADRPCDRRPRRGDGRRPELARKRALRPPRVGAHGAGLDAPDPRRRAGDRREPVPRQPQRVPLAPSRARTRPSSRHGRSSPTSCAAPKSRRSSARRLRRRARSPTSTRATPPRRRAP